ncbi:hypothetical protein [Lacinutrix sp. MedPE-SW]|uniref:hypothetical protein n=1 Tax=Lacinutrix sp. MedPE-SW TaxID=1860087 RepID=UPI00091C60EC|nr:hypothetical protein [Lacinutrix sp. MedPE-SW]OIQ21546.1 MAG: hypothetical protein BM549_08880 [Lacinutrix sp. MedPE-SW]
METYTVFTFKKNKKASKEILNTIKDWLIDKKIINPIPEENSKFNIYYGDLGFKEATDYDWFGEIEFIDKQCELQHVLGWDLGIDFMLPEKIVCPSCKTNLIEGIDPATFYGESNKKQDDEALLFLEAIKNGIKSFNAGTEPLIACFLCNKKHLISNYDYNLDMVFTNCAIVFWNWPELKLSFQEALKQKLGSQTIMLKN